MRPVKVTLAAQANSPWIPIDYQLVPMNLGLGVMLNSVANLTYSVQHTFDNFEAPHTISISRAGTVATVTDAAHGLSNNDSVVITGSGSSNLDTGIADVTVTGVNTYTYTVANSGPTSAIGFALNLRVFNHVSLVGVITRADGNYAFPIRGCRLRVSAYAAGSVDLIVVQGSLS